MTFKEAVEATPDIVTGYRIGLKALGVHSNIIVVSNTRHLQGSVDIDTCTSTNYPQASRWDYAIAYHNEVFFIEIHPAISSEVKTVLSKLQWLKAWLRDHAPELNALKAKSRNPFVWIQTKDFKILKNTPQYRAAVAAGLLPINRLEL